MVQLAEGIPRVRSTAMLEGRRDWGREAVMYVAFRQGRERLAEAVR